MYWEKKAKKKEKKNPETLNAKL